MGGLLGVVDTDQIQLECQGFGLCVVGGFRDRIDAVGEDVEAATDMRARRAAGVGLRLDLLDGHQARVDGYLTDRRGIVGRGTQIQASVVDGQGAVRLAVRIRPLVGSEIGSDQVVGLRDHVGERDIDPGGAGIVGAGRCVVVGERYRGERVRVQ